MSLLLGVIAEGLCIRTAPREIQVEFPSYEQSTDRFYQKTETVQIMLENLKDSMYELKTLNHKLRDEISKTLPRIGSIIIKLSTYCPTTNNNFLSHLVSNFHQVPEHVTQKYNTEIIKLQDCVNEEFLLIFEHDVLMKLKEELITERKTKVSFRTTNLCEYRIIPSREDAKYSSTEDNKNGRVQQNELNHYFYQNYFTTQQYQYQNNNIYNNNAPFYYYCDGGYYYYANNFCYSLWYPLATTDFVNYVFSYHQAQANLYNGPFYYFCHGGYYYYYCFEQTCYYWWYPLSYTYW